MNRTPADILNELLILRCQNGEVDAFEELFKQWQPLLFRHACRLTKHQEAAADIVQDSWLVMVKTLRKLDDPARFRTWAYRIVTNKVVDWIRHQQRTRSTLKDVAQQTEDAEEDVTSAGKQHLLGQLQAAMQMLPTEQRAILTMLYLDEMSVAEISEVLNIPPGTVKSRLFQARKILKEKIERSEQ